MSTHIKQYLEEHYPIIPNEQHCKSLDTAVTWFETRDMHSLALNTSLLAVKPMYFLDPDQEILFNIFKINKKQFKKDINTIPSIDPTRIVTSDPYNILSIYLIYCFFNSDLKNKYTAMFNILKLLHYKFFTSFLNHMLRYGATESIMRLVIEKLSNKYDIIKYGTWKKVIEHRCEDILLGKKDTSEDNDEKEKREESIHINTLKTLSSDDKILYVISDIQTRIKNRIKNVITIYHEIHSKGEDIGEYNLVTDIDGQKIINGYETIESMISGLSNTILNVNSFIDNQLIKAVVGMFKSNLREDTFRSVMIKFSELAVMQSKSGDFDKISKYDNKSEIYIGARILVSNILQKTYRYCIKDKTNIKSKTAIIIKTKNLYSASRVNDPDILNIKDSVHRLIISMNESVRPATITSIKLGFILYIMFKSFEYL